MTEDQIGGIQSDALARIGAARSMEELDAVRVDALGRKGALAQISKDMGKLAPEERAQAGKLLNAAKKAMEDAFERRKRAFEETALAAQLDSEWVDLTLPAAGPGVGKIHPITQIQMELEDLFTSL